MSICLGGMSVISILLIFFFMRQSSMYLHYVEFLCNIAILPKMPLQTKCKCSFRLRLVLQFPYQLMFPFAWDVSLWWRDISLGSREILQYFPYHYSYSRAPQKLGENSAHNDNRRRIEKKIGCCCHLCLHRCLQSPLPPHANI